MRLSDHKVESSIARTAAALPPQTNVYPPPTIRFCGCSLVPSIRQKGALRKDSGGSIGTRDGLSLGSEIIIT